MARSPAQRPVNQLNRLADRRFQVEVQQGRENDRYKARLATLNTQHAARLERFSKQAQSIDQQIWRLIDEYRESLLQRGKRSFATMVAHFKLRTLAAHTVILDKEGIMRVARERGLVRQIANPPKQSWRFDQAKFLALLNTLPKDDKTFEQFIERVDDAESLNIQPNTGYVVEYDGNRISPPSTHIEKS